MAVFEKGMFYQKKSYSSASQDKLIRDDKRDTLSGAQKTIAKTSPAGIRPIPEKLVRDNAPSIIEKQARKNWGIVCRKMASAKRITLNEAKKHNH